MEDRDFLAALRNDRIDAPCPFDGPINGERFHAYVEQFLVRRSSRATSILDNLGSHKGKAVLKVIRDVGARLVFLPKYSPDLNPIERVSSPSSKLYCETRKREATRRSPTPAVKSSPSTRPQNALHT
jgi:transposase